MIEVRLGKITNAEYGKVRDYPFLFGLQLSFSMDNSCVSDGGVYTHNISKSCRWSEEDRAAAFMKQAEDINEILSDAKVNCISQLVGKPVEIALEDRTFRSFRILKEVL